MANPIRREKVFLMRISDLERQLLDELAALDGITASDAVRILIRRSYETRIGPVPKPEPAPRAFAAAPGVGISDLEWENATRERNAGKAPKKGKK